MRLTAIATMVFCLAGPLAAAPSSEALEQSAQYVQDAQAAMELGNRQDAIIAALKALPDAPDDAAFVEYPDAHDMLFRAVASRIIHRDGVPTQYYAVNIDGTRAVAMAVHATQLTAGSDDYTIEMDPDTREMVVLGGPTFLPLEDEPPHILVDPRTGEVIADLLPFGAAMHGAYGPAFPAAFSHDGKKLAFWHMAEGTVRIFDTLVGTPLPSLTDLAGREAGHVVGFSPDGTQIAAKADGMVAIWDVATGDLIQSVPMPNDQWAVDWTYDGRLLGLRVDGYDQDAEAWLTILRDGRWDDVVSLTGRSETPTQYIQTSKSGPHVLLDAETRAYLVNFEADVVVDMGRAGASFHKFVRDGSAVAVLTPGGLMGFLRGALTLRVMALDGSELTATRRDWVAFDQYVTTDAGAPDNFTSVRPYMYRAEDVPEGPALWQVAMGLLSDAERAEVTAERIQP